MQKCIFMPRIAFYGYTCWDPIGDWLLALIVPFSWVGLVAIIQPEKSAGSSNMALKWASSSGGLSVQKMFV